MSDTKFTEGPFIIEPINDGHTYQITTPDPDFRVVSETVEHADALLQAAAPELYKALNVSNVFLKMIAEELDLDDDTSITVRVKKSGETVREIASFTLKDTVGKAEEVLAKARGEAV